MGLKRAQLFASIDGDVFRILGQPAARFMRSAPRRGGGGSVGFQSHIGHGGLQFQKRAGHMVITGDDDQLIIAVLAGPDGSFCGIANSIDCARAHIHTAGEQAVWRIGCGGYIGDWNARINS